MQISNGYIPAAAVYFLQYSARLLDDAACAYHVRYPLCHLFRAPEAPPDGPGHVRSWRSIWGAKPAYAVRKVILPQIAPGIVTGFLLAFTMSFDDFMISFFTSQGATQNLSTYIYSMARVGINPMINALSAIMFVVVITLLLVINLRSVKKTKRSPRVESFR